LDTSDYETCTLGQGSGIFTNFYKFYNQNTLYTQLSSWSHFRQMQLYLTVS